MLIGPVIDEEEGNRVLSAGEQLPGFTYLGDQSPAVVRNVMSAAAVFMNTSLHEGMSGAVLKAIAEGLPVLATRVSGSHSLIREGTSGLLVPLGNREEMVRAALKLADDPSLREKLGKGGRELALGRHAIKQEIDCHEHLYRTILSS